MKRTLLPLLVSLSVCNLSFAQITLTEEHLPEIGDTLSIAIDDIPTNITLGNSGPDQSWEFSNLQAPFAENYSVEKIQEANPVHENFYDADLFIQFRESLRGYYKLQGDALRYLGTSGTDPLNFGIDLPVRLEPEGLIERRVPLVYGDRYSSEGSANVAFASEDLPQAILNQLPIRPDSFRIQLEIERISEIDAWGQLLIPTGGPYPVLREKRIEIITTVLEAKFAFLPWQDISDLLPQNPVLGERVITSFYFLSDQAKEPIAVIRTNEEETEIISAEFKGGEVLTQINNVKGLRPGVFAFPNPAIINARFKFVNLPPDYYHLKIFNMLGNEIWKQKYFINGDATEKVDITHLRKGAYFYSLVDSKGKTLSTKRLIVLRP